MLDEAEFKRRFLSQYIDPAFKPLQGELGKVVDAAWDAYINSRKSPYSRQAGPGYAKPDYELGEDWLTAKAAVDAAQRDYEDVARSPRVLVINSASRSEHTCPAKPRRAIGWPRSPRRSSARRA